MFVPAEVLSGWSGLATDEVFGEVLEEVVGQTYGGGVIGDFEVEVTPKDDVTRGELDVETRRGQQQFHHALVDDVVGPASIGTFYVELSGEFSGFEIYVTGAEEVGDAVGDISGGAER